MRQESRDVLETISGLETMEEAVFKLQVCGFEVDYSPPNSSRREEVYDAGHFDEAYYGARLLHDKIRYYSGPYHKEANYHHVSYADIPKVLRGEHP